MCSNSVGRIECTSLALFLPDSKRSMEEVTRRSVEKKVIPEKWRGKGKYELDQDLHKTLAKYHKQVLDKYSTYSHSDSHTLKCKILI
jgi:hypothetical protein